MPEARCARLERRFRVMGFTLMAALTITVTLPFVSPAVAQTYGVTLSSLATRMTAVENKANTLDTDLGVVETKTASMSALTDPNTNHPTVRFTGVNVQIVNGLNATNGNPANPISPTGVVNGLGNLIIGYNELGNSQGETRSGSHNLVLGVRNTYTSFGGIVAGLDNSIQAGFASVLGGETNRATANFAVVQNGQTNTASGSPSSITGGSNNTTIGGLSVIVGGQFNATSVGISFGLLSTIIGGRSNGTSGTFSTVIGGQSNTATAQYSPVSGGQSRTASGNHDWVAGTLFQDN